MAEEHTLADVMAVVLRIDGRVGNLEQRFDGFELRFDGLERLANDTLTELVNFQRYVGERFDLVDTRFERVETRLKSVEAHVANIDRRLVIIDDRVSALER